MSKPIVLFNSIVTELNVTASHTETGYPASAVATPFTYDFWRKPAAAVAFLDIDAGEDVTADSLGWLGSHGATPVYSLESSDNGADYIEVVPQAFAIEGANVALFDAVTARYWRLNIGSTLNAYDVRNVMIGQSLEFERCIMKSHAPLPYNRVTRYTTNESGTGQFLGRSIIRQHQSTEVQMEMMSAPWSRDQFQGFVRHAEKKPFYFSWNPDKYPDEAGYVWTDEDIGISYTGDAALMTASWNMKGVARYES